MWRRVSTVESHLPGSLADQSDRSFSTRRFARKYAAEMIAVGLLLAMAVNMLSVVARKSITIDETLAIPAAFYHLKHHAYHIDSEHPPLPKILAALPLIFSSVKTPATDDQGNKPHGATVDAANRFWSANRPQFRVIFFWTRVPMVLLTILFGVLIFILTLHLFSARAATLAVALFSFDPTILAHGRVVKDVHLVYFLFFVALYFFWKRPSWWRAALFGTACGVALVVKHSMVILVPVLLGVFLILLVRPPSRVTRSHVLPQLLTAAIFTLLTINASYGFRHQPLMTRDAEQLQSSYPARWSGMQTVVDGLSALTPPYYVFGLYQTFKQNDMGHPAYLLGDYSEQGWWYYFPVTLALKTPIPFLLLISVSLVWAMYSFMRGEVKFVFLLIPVAIYSVTAMLTTINIGIRHLLPMFPFFFILAGAFLDRVLQTRKNRLFAIAVVSLIVATCVIEVVRAYPDYIPYMNQFTAGRSAWHYLSDSNVEWGDDAGALADYLKTRGETQVRAAFLGGASTLPLYGVQYVDLLDSPEIKLPDTRYVAIGASFLNGSTVPGWSAGSGRETPEQRHRYFAHYRDRKPEAVFGKSIYLFRERE